MFGFAANFWAKLVLEILVLLERLTPHFALVFPSVSVHVVALKMVDSPRGSVSQVRSLFVPRVFCCL